MTTSHSLAIGIHTSYGLGIFHELITGLRSAFAAHSIDIPVVENPPPSDPRTFIMIGPSFDRHPWPSHFILYNCEQPGYGWMERDSFATAASRALEVWDLSINNLPWWTARGLSARYVPLHPCEEWTLDPSTSRLSSGISIPFHHDFAMLGWHTPRRTAAFSALRAGGISVLTPRDALFTNDREALYNHASFILNLHAYDCGSILETMRILPALWHGRTVLSEWVPGETPAGMPNLATLRHLNDLVPAARELITAGRAEHSSDLHTVRDWLIANYCPKVFWAIDEMLCQLELK